MNNSLLYKMSVRLVGYITFLLFLVAIGLPQVKVSAEDFPEFGSSARQQHHYRKKLPESPAISEEDRSVTSGNQPDSNPPKMKADSHIQGRARLTDPEVEEEATEEQGRTVYFGTAKKQKLRVVREKQ
ncbi:MAG: hypothetical protein PHC51_06550, partial [bacterium]|nr:hypothetical protein [bacterium]